MALHQRRVNNPFINIILIMQFQLLMGKLADLSDTENLIYWLVWKKKLCWNSNLLHSLLNLSCSASASSNTQIHQSCLPLPPIPYLRRLPSTRQTSHLRRCCFSRECLKKETRQLAIERTLFFCFFNKNQLTCNERPLDPPPSSSWSQLLPLLFDEIPEQHCQTDTNENAIPCNEIATVFSPPLFPEGPKSN